MREGFLTEHRQVGSILQAAVGVSVVLILTGLGLLVAQGGEITLDKAPQVPKSGTVFDGLLTADPVSIITIGLMVLLVTPFIRVIGAVYSFIFVEKDPTYAVISLGILAVLIAGLFIPGLR